VTPEWTVFRLEAVPRLSPGVPRFDGQISDIAAEVIATDFGKAFESEWCDCAGRRRTDRAELVKTVKEFLERRRESD
jgi:hypothetical protein